MNSVIAVDVNSLTQTTGGIMTVPPVSVSTFSASLQYVNNQLTVTVAPKRKWTGKPRGKMEEQQNENIRKRISYKWLVNEAIYFRKVGIPIDCLHHVLSALLEQRIRLRGFSYRSNGYWARQSMELLSKDLQDYNMVEKLGLQ